VMRTMARALDGLATSLHLRQAVDSLNAHPKEEPFKRYTYAKNGLSDSAVPYTTEWPGGTPGWLKRERAVDALKFTAVDAAMRTARRLRRGGDAEIDDHLTGMVKRRAFGFGF